MSQNINVEITGRPGAQRTPIVEKSHDPLIPVLLREQGDAVDRLTEALGALVDRLAPILNEKVSESNPTPVQTFPVPLAGPINVSTSRIGYLRLMVEDLINRLEI